MQRRKFPTVEVLRPVEVGSSGKKDDSKTGTLKTGCLLKKSETLKRWNKRVFMLELTIAGKAILRWSEHRMGAALMKLTPQRNNIFVIDKDTCISWYESGDRRKIEIKNYTHTIYVDSAHLDKDIAFHDLNSWYMIIGEHIRDSQFNSRETSNELDEDVIEAMIEAANEWQERKLYFLRHIGRTRRDTSFSFSSSSSSSLLNNQQSLDMTATYRDQSSPILQNAIDILEWSSFCRYKLKDFKGAKDRRYQAALCHFVVGRLREAIQTSEECLMLLPSGAPSKIARRASLKICKDFKELERCMDPLHVLDLLKLDQNKSKIEDCFHDDDDDDDEESDEEDEMENEELVRDITDRMLASEGYSALSFLNLVSVLRDEKSPEPSLYRHRDAPSSFSKFEEAQTSSTKLHYVSDLLPLLPRDFSDDVSVSLAHTKMPDSIKTAVQLVSDTVRSFNYIVLDGSGETLQSDFGESTFTKLLDILQNLETNVRALGLPIWPCYTQKGLGWVAIGRVLRCTIVNRKLLRALQFLARYKKARESDWWRLVRISDNFLKNTHTRARMSLSYLLSSQQNAINSIMKSSVTELKKLNDLAKSAQRSIRVALELAGTEMLHLVAVPKQLASLVEARRTGLQDYTIRLQKMSLLCKDIIRVVHVNLRLWRESEAISNIPRISSQNSGDTALSKRKQMVGSYALERAALPSLHIPAHQLRRLHEHWSSLFTRTRLMSGSKFAVPQRIVDDLQQETDLRAAAVLEKTRTIIRTHKNISKITYLQIKTQLMDEFGSELVKSVKHKITNMIMQAVESNGTVMKTTNASEKQCEEDKDEEEEEEIEEITFAKYLLLYPYKSSADIKLLMQTRPVQSAALQQSRLLLGVSRSVVSYWEKDEQREPFKVLVENTFRWKASGSERMFGAGHRHEKDELVDTSEMQTFQSGLGVGMIVFRSNVCVVHSHLRDRFHHSSVFAGKSVNFAGEIKIEKGKIKWISNKSGHYQPGLDCVRFILRHFQDSCGVLLSEFPFDLVHSTRVSPEIMNFISNHKGSTQILKRYNSNSQSKFLRVNPASVLLAALEKFGVE